MLKEDERSPFTLYTNFLPPTTSCLSHTLVYAHCPCLKHLCPCSPCRFWQKCSSFTRFKNYLGPTVSMAASGQRTLKIRCVAGHFPTCQLLCVFVMPPFDPHSRNTFSDSNPRSEFHYVSSDHAAFLSLFFTYTHT